MKRRIKLTESDLHRVIKESVKNILSELDWKTKVNAANKALKNYNSINNYDEDLFRPTMKYYDELSKRDKQLWNLKRYADEGLRQEFGDDSYYAYNIGDDEGTPVVRQNFNPDDEEFYTYYPSNEEGDRTWYKNNYNYGYMPSSFENTPQEFQKKAKKVQDFYDGNYEYIKGKGWQLKNNK